MRVPNWRVPELPQGEELKILEGLRDNVPPEVFTTPYANPVAGTPENVRANLREGMRLLREAGYEVRDYKQVNIRTGEVLSVEILGLTSDPSGADRLILFYKPALVRLGNSPGHSFSSSFGNIALSRMVAVAWSITLSTSRSFPRQNVRYVACSMKRSAIVQATAAANPISNSGLA